jgi:aspartyl protease family protein
MDTKTMGTGMMLIACILGMGLLTMFFSEAEEHQRNPNRSPSTQINAQSLEVVLERNRQGHYLVNGTINHRSAEFLLDTGATDVVIPAQLAAEYGLRRGTKAIASTANGNVTVYSTMIDQLTIGDITLYGVRASINPGMPPPAILLGMSALKQIEFFQRGGTLTLRQAATE